jgi:uncharacterized membrane protein
VPVVGKYDKLPCENREFRPEKLLIEVDLFNIRYDRGEITTYPILSICLLGSSIYAAKDTSEAIFHKTFQYLFGNCIQVCPVLVIQMNAVFVGTLYNTRQIGIQKHLSPV